MSELRKSNGFTLIELMIVVAIIGILAAVAIPKFASLTTKSKEASVKGGLGAIRSAVSIYYGDMEGQYPRNLFIGLASGNRYMPPINGSPSLGTIVIPPHTLNGGNMGHSVQNVQAADVAEGTFADGSGFYYEFTEGSVYISCSHNDTKGTPWSGY